MKRSFLEAAARRMLNRPLMWFLIYSIGSGALLYYILCASFRLPVVFWILSMALLCALAFATLRAIPEILLSRETERFSREPCVRSFRETLDFVLRHGRLYSDPSERALNEAFCLRYEGRFAQAAETLERSGFPRKTGSEVPFFFCGTYAEILFCLDRAADTDPFLEQMRQTLDAAHGEKRVRMAAFYSRLNAERLLSRGAAEDALALVSSLRRKDDTPLTTLSDRWLKGRALAALGKKEDALREFDAVICEGNDLCFVEQARDAKKALSPNG